MEKGGAAQIIIHGQDLWGTNTRLFMESRQDAVDLRSDCVSVILSDYVAVLLRTRFLRDGLQGMEHTAWSDDDLSYYSPRGDLAELLRRELYFLNNMWTEVVTWDLRVVDVESNGGKILFLLLYDSAVEHH